MQQENKKKLTKFGEVLEQLKKSGISNGSVGRTISKNKKIVLDKDAVRRLKNGERLLNEEIIEGMKECYNINPHYLMGTSDVMLDILDDDFKIFSCLVKDWKLEDKTYVDEEGKRKKKIYLVLTIKKVLCDFLAEFGVAKKLKDMGMQSYNEEFLKYKEKYGNEMVDEYSEYIILPKKVLFEIVESGIDGLMKIKEELDFCQFEDRE